ncbi:MAG: hypothetical protein DMD75_17430 [Candidatus Rokuibacteriota bacterium]|nr:MAG: hypothetical protein DMD75_17430 [Candidatus Rokubacteria bacterium]
MNSCRTLARATIPVTTMRTSVLSLGAGTSALCSALRQNKMPSVTRPTSAPAAGAARTEIRPTKISP